MPSLTYAGVPEPRGEMAATFFRDWFGEEDKLLSTITLINPIKRAADSARTRHFHESPANFREMFTDPGSLKELIYLDDQRWNAYQGVGLMEVSPGARRKGGKRDITMVPGVWVDLDVAKEGVFTGLDHCLNLLRTTYPYPTAVVATGTGGVHGYWKVEGGMDADMAEEFATRQWALLSAEADAKIDKLVNCDRVMKLPGTIRWEKDPGDQPALVELLYSSPEAIPRSKLIRATDLAYADYLERIQATRRQLASGRVTIELLKRGELAGAGRWGALMSAASLEEEFNQTHTWHEILEPLGWQDIGTDSEGRTLWARPDQDRDAKYKSAATGFQGSNVMTLFSDSPVTGLWPLAEAGIPLTKYRVWVQTRYNGDEAAYVKAYYGVE